MSRTVRVLIVDDDRLVRWALGFMLAKVEGIDLVGEAADGAQVPAAVQLCRPDVVLMDIRMPGTDGLTAIEALRAAPSPPEVIVLTTFDADELVLRAIRAGASGFLLKDTAPTEIVAAIERVADGEAMLSPGITRQLITRIATLDPMPPRRVRATALLETLSEREREVAGALARGLSNADIADELYMSVPTVKSHVSRLLVKLDADNRTQVALLAHDAGFV